MARSSLCRLIPTAETWRKCGPDIAALVVLEVCLVIAGCGGGTTSTPGGNQVSTLHTPRISTISPTSNLAGSPAFTLTVDGANFLSSSVVNFGGSAVVTTFVSSTQLNAAIPAAAIASTSTATVTVTSPGPGGGTSNGVSFAINSGTNPIPTISFLDPGCAPVGAQTFTLSVAGTNFASSSVVRWNGKDLATTVNGGLLAKIPANDIATTGTAAVTVFNPAPGGGESNPATFNIAAGGVGPTSMAIDPTGKFAYVANEGCAEAFDGSVSMYTINPTDGTLTSAGPSLTTGDLYANSVGVDPSAKFVYVANSGGDFGGSVSMYTLNPTDGALTSIGKLGAGVSPQSVAIHPSGKFVYAADEGGFVPTSVLMFAINAGTGTLTLIGTVAVDGRATALAVDPSGKFAYVADGYQNTDGSKGVNVSMYTIDAVTGILKSIGKIAAGMSPCSIVIHPSGKFVYVTNCGSNDISMYTIDTTTGNLTLFGTIAAAGLSAIHPSGKFAYVRSSGSASIYTIDATTGALTFAGPAGVGSSPVSITTIHPSGKFAYGINRDANGISMYSIDGTTGSLTLIGTIGT